MVKEQRENCAIEECHREPLIESTLFTPLKSPAACSGAENYSFSSEHGGLLI